MYRERPWGVATISNSTPTLIPATLAPERRTKAFVHTMKKYMCLICGYIYDEETGAPDEGIPAGTRWEDVPPNWTCPECGARKEDFEMIEF